MSKTAVTMTDCIVNDASSTSQTGQIIIAAKYYEIAKLHQIIVEKDKLIVECHVMKGENDMLKVENDTLLKEVDNLRNSNAKLQREGFEHTRLLANALREIPTADPSETTRKTSITQCVAAYLRAITNVEPHDSVPLYTTGEVLTFPSMLKKVQDFADASDKPMYPPAKAFQLGEAMKLIGVSRTMLPTQGGVRNRWAFNVHVLQAELLNSRF